MMKKIITIVLSICAIMLMYAGTVSADTIPVYLGGDFTAGSSIYVSESGFETNDSILEAYLEYGASYQWYVNDAPIPGATSSSLYLDESYGGKYVSVVVTIGSHSGNSGAYYIEYAHMCIFEEGWLTDEYMHWHECSCGAVGDDESHNFRMEHLKSDMAHWYDCLTCGYISGWEVHTWSAWSTVINPTDKADGLQRRSCTVCSYYEEEVIPKLPHTHDFGAVYFDDAVSHWKECECGERAEEGAHSYGPWIVSKEPTPTESGEQYHSCSVCGLKIIQAIAYEAPAEEERDEADSTKGKNEDADPSGKGKGKNNNSSDETDSDTEQEAEAEVPDENASAEKPSAKKPLSKGASLPWGLIGGIAVGVIALLAVTLILILRKKKD